MRKKIIIDGRVSNGTLTKIDEQLINTGLITYEEEKGKMTQELFNVLNQMGVVDNTDEKFTIKIISQA